MTYPAKLIAQERVQSENPSITLETNKTDVLEVEQNHWAFLHGYSAKYAIRSDGETLGHATRKLSHQDDQWKLITSAKLSKYFITLRSKEYTEFHLEDSQLINDRFYSSTKMTFKKARIMEQNFDWQNKLETGKRGKRTWEIPLENQIFDRVSHIIQLRADLLAGKQTFEYDVSYKGKLHLYSYSKEKEEVLTTKMGELSTVKLVRNKSDDDIFTLWLSPELNYLPIKIAQYEQDKPDVTLLLESLDYESQAIIRNETKSK